MSFATLWLRIKTAVEGEAVAVETVFTDLEQKLLPSFDNLLKQIEKTIGQQGLQILEDGLKDVATAISSGGNVGAIIAALVPQVTAIVKDDLKQDATNAAHGVVALLIASLPTTVPSASTTA